MSSTRTDYDAVVIGGGLLGCFTARALARYRIRVALIEKREDVCTGMSRANTAIVYGGYDTHPGSLKTRLLIKANAEFDRLCGQLGVRFKRCGSLMVAFGPNGEEVLKSKYQQGLENGVPDLRLIDRDEVLAMEPAIADDVVKALYCPGAGTVTPWELCMAGAENAAANGVSFHFNTEVMTIRRRDSGFAIHTDKGIFTCKAVANCAGMRADDVADMVHAPSIRIVPTRGDYIVLDNKAGSFIRHVIFHESEENGKGLTAVPTIEGNILLGPSTTRANDKNDAATRPDGLDIVREQAMRVLPGIPLDQTIRTFSAIRPKLRQVEIDPDSGEQRLSKRSIGDFGVTLWEDCPGFVSLIGIKTPGLTCSETLGEYTASLLLPHLGDPQLNPDFDPCRKPSPKVAEMDGTRRAELAAKAPEYSRVVCRCRTITEGEILDAIRAVPGAVTVDGVKYRAGTCLGRCQGSYCTQRIVELLAQELGCSVGEISKAGPGSWIFASHDDDQCLCSGEEPCHE